MYHISFAYIPGNAVIFSQLLNELAILSQPSSLPPHIDNPESSSSPSTPASSSTSPSPLTPDTPHSHALETIGNWGGPSRNAFVLTKEATLNLCSHTAQSLIQTEPEDTQPPKTADVGEIVFEVSEIVVTCGTTKRFTYSLSDSQ